MLEQPGDAAPGPRAAAAAMDCRDRPVLPGRKLVQARLPFKRLNLAPKDKVGYALQRVPAGGPDAVAEPSLDNLENDCPSGSDLDLRPRLINGRGPLDSFLSARLKPSAGMVIIDLTTEEDSNEPPPRDPHAAATGPGTPRRLAAQPEKDVAKPPVAITEPPGSDDQDVRHPATLGRTLGFREDALQRCPEPRDRPRPHLTKDPPSWSEAGGILFREKVPVVVLEDILAPKPPRPGSPSAAPLDRSSSSDSDGLESCPEDPPSRSPTSSPEGPPAPPAHPSGASPTSTPICHITKKPTRGSAEKGRTQLQRDREQLRQEARRAREEAREEARRKKEEERELRDRERRQRREKEEKEKAEKQRLKEERRRERQEALEAKLEEKRKKEEEKRLREEEKRIKAEKAEITRFFQKPKTPQAPKTLAGSCGKFAPFEIKEHMILAPRCRASLDQDLCVRLDRLLQAQGGPSAFLSELKGRAPLTSGPTRCLDAGTGRGDVVIVSGMEVPGGAWRRPGRMKLLQFCENHRPAYWGTWSKTTTTIRPRRPWAQDKSLLDYEVDSDEEWEEEEPGESLSHSEGDEDDDGAEDEDDDDGFFVPHGYLSEDEGVTEECADPGNQEALQKLRAQEWAEFLAKGSRVSQLQPVVVGCVWADTVGSCEDADLKLLKQFAARLLGAAPPQEESPKNAKREKRDQQILAQLLPLLHGNVNSSKVIIREFQEHCRRGLLGPAPAEICEAPEAPEAAVPSKARLKRLISQNSVYEKRPDFRMCWYVHAHVLRSFRQERLPVPCQWSYVTAAPAREDAGPGAPPPLKRKAAGTVCITQFMKKPRREAGAGDVDGFQADTEDEDEDESDCMVVDVPAGAEALEPSAAAPEAALGMGASQSPLRASLLGAS